MEKSKISLPKQKENESEKMKWMSIECNEKENRYKELKAREQRERALNEVKERTEHCRTVAIKLREILEPLQREIEKYKRMSIEPDKLTNILLLWQKV